MYAFVAAQGSLLPFEGQWPLSVSQGQIMGSEAHDNNHYLS